jgi:hypothetical protein
LYVLQPWAERQNEEERQDFLEKLRFWAADPAIEQCFSNECGVEGTSRTRRRWVQLAGAGPCDQILQIVIGAVAPQRGALFSLIVS